MAILDWFGRYVLPWRLPNKLDGPLCVEALGKALGRGRGIDNLLVERRWRSVKYDKVHLKEYATEWET